jgi:glyoxylase-like metal-dependent hydrolase (beta-lactamase superfamily II)
MEIQTFGLGPLRTNCYVVSDAGEAVLIDAGAFSEEVVSYLKEQQLT